jgi:hypothetical protein
MPEKNETKVPRPEKSNRTGEDIDMLHEKETDPESSNDYGSESYKNNYDAA